MPDDKMKDRKPRTKAEPRDLDEAEREIIGRADTDPGPAARQGERDHADADDPEPRDRGAAGSGKHPDDVHDERG